MTPTDASLPPIAKTTPIGWLRRNLFNTWYNSLLTLVCLALLYQGLRAGVDWILTQAQWTVIQTNLRLFFVGRYPPSLVWRIWVALGGLVGLVGASWGAFTIWKSLQRWLIVAWLLALPILLWLIGGGWGLTTVGTNLWNGLLLTMLLAVVSIVLAFPLGVLLALGRKSQLPVVRWFCTLYIEIVRGLPLIGILFMAQVMLPLILPTEWRLDRLIRAIAGLVLFNAAYLAENVRAGLQAVPKGQVEAARALGLNPLLVVGLIVLPQALRAVIPAIVGQFISLFKDTSLLSIFALVELTGIARSILAQPQFLGRYMEVYLFVGLLYWLFCYSMSIASRRLEQRLNIGQRRN